MTNGRFKKAARRVPSASLFLASLAIVIYSFPALAEALQYDRLAIEGGELWRLVTGHWTHWTLDHLLWDVAVFFGLGVACEPRNRWRFVLCVAAATFLIPATVFVFAPGIGIYRGLSGLDSALFSLLAVSVFLEKLEQRQWGWVGVGVGFIVAFMAKTAFEVTTGDTVFVSASPGIAAVPLAHAMGAMVGIVASLAPYVSNSSPKSRPFARWLRCGTVAVRPSA